MIYDFIYAFFYQLNEKIGSNDSKFYSRAFVILTIFFHIFFVIAIFETKTGGYLKKAFGFSSSKYVFLPFVLLMMWILEYLFKKRADRIIKKYEGKKLVTIPKGLVIFFIVFVPLILGAFFLST